jgi:hypothetical protein
MTKTVAPSATKTVARTQTGPFELPVAGKITVVNANAKSPATKGGIRFALYRNGMTVQQYMDASTKAGNRLALAKADLMWDFNHGFIAVSDTKLKPLGAPQRGRSATEAPAKAEPAKAGKVKSKEKPAPQAAA